MKNYFWLLILVMSFAVSGCSGAFWGGAAGGGAAGAAGYELRSKQQMDRVEEQYKKGEIDQREYEIRKDQIRRGSIVY